MKIRPSLNAAYDYYPFGMLMPGRYVQGASDSCIFTTTTRWVPQWTQTFVNDWATVSPAGVTPDITWNPDSGPNESSVLSVAYPGGGITAQLSVSPGVRQNILIPVQSNNGGQFRITATQGTGDDSLEIAYQILQGEGDYVLDFTPTTGNVRLNIIRVMGSNDGTTADITLLSTKRWVLSYTNQNQLVQICPIVKDEYRFGFNGQQKDNEYAGIGNHNTALFWEYDTRLGRRWNTDPKSGLMPNESPYATNHDNPILYKDEKGDIGIIGGAIGLVVGGGIDLGGQIISGMMQGQSFRTAIKQVDWADVALSSAEGAAAGATGGMSLLAHGAFSAARATVDVKQSNNWRPQSVLGYVGIGDKKSGTQMLIDAGTEAIGLGMKGLGKMADAELGMGKKHFGKSFKGNLQQEMYGGIKALTTELPLKNAVNVMGNSAISQQDATIYNGGELPEVEFKGTSDGRGDGKFSEEQKNRRRITNKVQKVRYLRTLNRAKAYDA